MYRILTLLMFVLLVFPGRLASQDNQSSITGAVTDSDTGEPLEFVQVYISGSSTGTVTDQNGEYRFSTDLAGNHVLVISLLGHETVSIPLNLSGSGQNISYDIELEQMVIELDDIEVSASPDRRWRRNFRTFNRLFLGRSEFAGETAIQNPWIIDFERQRGGVLIATAMEPLRIKNTALGYEIHAEIEEFRWNRSGISGIYVVHTRFEEMEPENTRESDRWEENRRHAYRGSFRHFLLSLYNDRVADDGFRISREDSRERASIDTLGAGEMQLRLQRAGLFLAANRRRVKGYHLPAAVSVAWSSSFGEFVSGLYPETGDVLFVTDSGQLLDPRSVGVTGYWFTNRIADMIPVDYE